MAFVAFGQAGEIKDLYEKWVRPRPADPQAEQQRFERLMDPVHRVTEIGLERGVCYGACPEYSVVFKSDGTFTYHGIANVPRLGRHRGEFSTYEFNQLAELLLKTRYSDMPPTWGESVVDLPTVYTTAVIDGRRKLVSNKGGVGPVELWSIEQCIDGLLREARWEGDDSPPMERP
jgi:hypothetical protein